MFVASLIWKVDYYHGTYGLLRQVANGWSIAPIITLNSGLPYNFSTGTDNNLDGNTGNDRPNLVPGVQATLDPNRARSAAVAEWFNTAAFLPNAVGTNGTLGRNGLDAPGLRNVDLGIFRDFKITEKVNLQFRADSTNAFNMVNLNSPRATFPRRPSDRSRQRVLCGRYNWECDCNFSACHSDRAWQRFNSVLLPAATP